jgi:RNA polymerase sigma factor (sigma-70 family)
MGTAQLTGVRLLRLPCICEVPAGLRTGSDHPKNRLIRSLGYRHGRPNAFEVTGSMSLADTVAAARGGDHGAWDSLVERYMPLVLGVAVRFRLSAEDVADVSQAVWLRLVEHLDDIREPRALPGWIVTTTHNEALRLLRARRRTVPVDPQTGTTPLDEPVDGAELVEDLLRLERHQALRDGLRELRPGHRALLLLLLSDPPLSYDEISRRLGMPKGSIGPTRARCLEELRGTSALRALLSTSDRSPGR